MNESPGFESNAEHTVLFSHPRGREFRWMARTSLIIGGTVIGLSGSIIARASLSTDPGTLSPLLIGIALLLSVSGLGFIVVSCHLARQFVVHLEVWPKSAIAVVRTANCYRESIRLVGWREFRDAQIISKPNEARGDPWLRVRLCSGENLILDHTHGEAPQGWAAVHAFLQNCRDADREPTEASCDDSESTCREDSRLPLSNFDSLRA